ncbi:lysophospholipid acyltransferase family protein [Paracoccus aerodenitrificans]|uniref:lysophospholipid acyltransferase family protein n=1 Tax=Paracoccus aerodenitrificans TaxID=3017781 RepID=UPI0022F00F54|nr:lysophospholipid acyltransferase family protein [Paracoccus aerodenitrificans]WBU63316.1 lysophospholipid acyltransferase family protein [Paracoccus aerodenitrificans]
MIGPLLRREEAAHYSPVPRSNGAFGYVCAVTYYIHVGLATVVLGTWGMLTQIRKGRRGANRVATIWIGYMLRAARWHNGVAVEIRGEPPQRGEDALIAAKHQSFLDILAIASAAGRRAFVMKREIMHIPIMGWYAREVGCIPIDRTRGRDAMGQIIRQIRERMASEDGVGHLIVYPEGTRTRPGEHRPYKHGVGTIHLETGLPVWPVAVNCGMFWPKRGIPIASGRAVIEFLPPMQAEPGESRDDFIARLRETIETRSDALMQEAGSGPAS